MSEISTAIDYNLTSLPHTPGEMLAAKEEIHAWYASGAVISAAPVDALTTAIQQTLATGDSRLSDLADPAKRQAMSLELKQKYLDELREFVRLHKRREVDAAGLQAEAESLRSAVQKDGMEESKKVAKWTKLATVLQKKEDLMGLLAEKVVELEAEEGWK